MRIPSVPPKIRSAYERLREAVRPLEKPLALIGAAAGLTVILMNLEFSLLEANLYDFRMTHGNQPEASEDIVLVTLDDTTTRRLNDFAPLPLDYHARFLEALEAHYNPAAVGYLVNMNFVSQINPDLFDTEWGRRFVNSARRLEEKGSPVVLGTRFDITGEVLPPYPLSSLKHSISVIHQDGNVFSDDKITRRALISLYNKPTFHLTLAREAGRIGSDYIPSGTFRIPEADGRYFFFRYHGDTALKGERGVDLPYPTIPFVDLLEAEVDPEALRGKTLLVGTLTRENPYDFALTPYSKSPFVNPKLAVHANILDSVVRDDGVILAPEWVNWLTTFLATVFVLWWVLNSTPLYGVIATFSLALLFVVISQLLFQGVGTDSGVWLKMAQPLVGIFLGYYLVVPYRLIREYKKRWEYQRRNELLTQVEELKTNFLSLVTHDLKTPVARIQGLTEVVLSRAGARLEEPERRNLHHIVSSTDELNRFISSILELTKIESARIQLNLESKDVNQIIERAVERFEAQARSKDIRLTTDLEPLFPIRLDPSLISKVISNLVDNAIKYSPEGSEITIATAESEEWVEIAIQDQGIGMSEDEARNVFSRFYRVKNQATARTPGTGLGLYLSRYFIEVHRGEVALDSAPGKGSIFTIRLPMELEHGEIRVVSREPQGGFPGLKLVRMLFTKRRREADVQSTRS